MDNQRILNESLKEMEEGEGRGEKERGRDMDREREREEGRESIVWFKQKVLKVKINCRYLVRFYFRKMGGGVGGGRQGKWKKERQIFVQIYKVKYQKKIKCSCFCRGKLKDRKVFLEQWDSLGVKILVMEFWWFEFFQMLS